jgi:hypothetical protein
MFVHERQPVNPALPCSVIHVVPTLHGKGAPEIVEKLLRLREILIRQFTFHVAGGTSDDDLGFNILHSEFEDG